MNQHGLRLAAYIQWLGRWSLDYGLSSNCVRSIVVGKLSAVGQPTTPTQPCIPPGLVSGIAHGLWEWGLSNGRPGLRMAVWLQVTVRGRGLGPRPIGCTPAVFVTKASLLRKSFPPAAPP